MRGSSRAQAKSCARKWRRAPERRSLASAEQARRFAFGQSAKRAARASHAADGPRAFGFHVDAARSKRSKAGRA
ncbi:hypothetical protein SA96_19110 [Burkholderia mallei]|nr:hypothetical protein AS002_00735 [Burkholderia mallei]RJE62306.1 hypothetical protein SA96_19110 [Burkholderia mallei]